MEPLLKIRNLSKTYNIEKEEHVRVKALKEITLDIHPGEFVAVVGTSGSGKSTLIHCIGSFEKPNNDCYDAIQYNHNGKFINIWHNTEWYRQNSMGVVFQAFHLLPNLRVWQNVEIPLKLMKCERFTPNPNERHKVVQDVLRSLGIEHLFEKKVTELSGGESQRIAIARALVKSPRLLLADEPTGNLDKENKRNIVEILGKLTVEGVAVVMVTHDEDLVRDRVNRIVRLEDGKVIEDVYVSNEKAEVAGAGLPHPASSEALKTQKAVKGLVRETEKDVTTEHAAQENTVSVKSLEDTNLSFIQTTHYNGKTNGESTQSSQTMVKSSDAKGRVGNNLFIGKEDSPGKGGLTTKVRKLLSALNNYCKGGIHFIAKRYTSFQLPGSNMRFHHLTSFAVRDARESSVSFVANVVAILFGTFLTALLLSLVFGAKMFKDKLLPTIPGIGAVHIWVDYSTGAEPMTEGEFERFKGQPDVITVVPNIKQITYLYERKIRETIVSINSAIPNDPETMRLKLIKGTTYLDPEGWDVLLTEMVASEIDNIDPYGLVGKEITLELRRYKKDEASGELIPSKILEYPVRVVGIVQTSPQERIYGSLNMVRFIRDFSTMRSEYVVNAGEKIDATQISPRTFYEGVRLHFPDPYKAENAFTEMKQKYGRGSRFDVYWPGQDYLFLSDVLFVAFIVLSCIGLLTVIAGSISIFNTLNASVAQKTREIGILRALGVTRVSVFVIYILQSLFVGLLAGCIGIVGSWILSKLLNKAVIEYWEIKRIESLFYLPVHVALGIFGIILLVCLFAAFVPSWRASQKTPMDAIRLG